MSTPTVILNESNRVAVRLQSGVEAYYSYKTLVGVVAADGTRYRTEVMYSRTTSKHLGQFRLGNAEKVSQSALEAMVK